MSSILVIDDDKILNEMMCELLLNYGYSTISAFDGNEGISKLQSEDISLVITDIIMPDKEGLQTIREIKSVSPDIPIIAISGGGKHNADYLSMAGLMGANFTFRKPFDHEEFMNAVKSCIEA